MSCWSFCPAGVLGVRLDKVLISLQASPGEALSKDELQSGVDVANQIADGVVKSEFVSCKNAAHLCQC